MPESMQKQMVSIQFSEPVGEHSLEWSVKLGSLPPEDRLRLELVDNTISKSVIEISPVYVHADIGKHPVYTVSKLH